MRKFYIIVLPLLVVLCLILAFSGLQNMFIIDNVEFLGILFSGTCLFALAYMYFKGTLKAKKYPYCFTCFWYWL
jgi:F0F1-type ATP synthase assembly protein I